jgi:hypothetical protein
MRKLFLLERRRCRIQECESQKLVKRWSDEQWLKYIFEDGGTVQISRPHHFLPGPLNCIGPLKTRESLLPKSTGPGTAFRPTSTTGDEQYDV